MAYDVMEIALRDYIGGIRGSTFVHRDDGFIAPEQIDRYFKTYNEWGEVERRLFASICGTVLEIGCNIGEHLRYLQENDLNGIGIDISPGAVKLAIERGIKNCFIMDARNMAFSKGFDTVLILYYGFGLGGTPERQNEMLRAIHQITNPGAMIICSSIDALKTDDPQHIRYQDFNKRKGKAYGDITQVTLRIQHGDMFGDWYDLLFINPRGLPQLIKNTGWSVSEIIPEREGGRSWYYVLSRE